MRISSTGMIHTFHLHFGSVAQGWTNLAALVSSHFLVSLYAQRRKTAHWKVLGKGVWRDSAVQANMSAERAPECGDGDGVFWRGVRRADVEEDARSEVAVFRRGS